MHKKVCKKHIWICLLACSLIFAYGTTLIGVSFDGYLLNSSSINGGAERSSMSGATVLWHVNDLAITATSAEILVAPAKHSQWLLFSVLTSWIAARIICLFFSSRLAGSLCSQFDSIQITLFLHEKDGMK